MKSLLLLAFSYKVRTTTFKAKEEEKDENIL